ncbi:MAG TPA: cell wall hydrolase, partial [Roseiarcus sp.]|nr:cell wall hydrolase [Roseiarcus sp.]
MGGSRLGWALNAIAPWCVALGLVSITAEAGQDPAQGGSVAIEGAESPVRQALNAATFQLPDPFDGAGSSPYFVEASLTLGAPDELAAVDDEVDPRPDLKQVADAFPTVDRTLKGDPFLGLRPGFDARRLRRPTIIEGGATGPADGDGEVSFSEPYGSALSYSEETLGAGAPEWSAPAPAKEALTFDDGATPSVPLEAALNSATPAPSDDVPIATVAAKPEEPGADTSEIAKTLPNGQPDYASLIDQKDAARQQRCLAEAIYFEARSEPEDGQAAVAQVVLNRV